MDKHFLEQMREIRKIANDGKYPTVRFVPDNEEMTAEACSKMRATLHEITLKVDKLAKTFRSASYNG